MKHAQAGGSTFFIIGIAFVIVGISGQRTFLWIGIPFLITGMCGFAISRSSGSESDQSEGSEPPQEEENS